jgi:hypothetical protein
MSTTPAARETPPATWRDRLPGGFGDAVSLFVAMRVALGLAVIYLWWRGGLPGPCHYELARDNWLTIPPLADQGPAFPLVGVWQRWDACWYSKIATFGYEPTELSVNFWPLFPLFTRAVGSVIGSAQIALAGLIVSAITYIAAMVGLYRLVARDVDAETARRTMLFITIFPSAFFLFAPFTEALFLSLAVWAMVGARERIWWLAALAGFLAALTRIQGVFLVFPLGWEALAAAGLLRRPWPPAIETIARRPLLTGLASTIGPALGFLGFLAYSAVTVGQTPLDTQEAWGGKDFFPPWAVVDAAWRWAVERADPLQALNLALLIVFGILLIVGARRLPFSYTLYALPQYLLLATRIQPTPLTATNRYLLVIFPAFVVLALIPWQGVRLTWAITSLLLLGILLVEFQTGTFVA